MGPIVGFPIEQIALQRWVSSQGLCARPLMFGPLRTARS
jgi:hypothetical protein